jgi:hypothetical protein
LQGYGNSLNITRPTMQKLSSIEAQANLSQPSHSSSEACTKCSTKWASETVAHENCGMTNILQQPCSLFVGGVDQTKLVVALTIQHMYFCAIASEKYLPDALFLISNLLLL